MLKELSLAFVWHFHQPNYQTQPDGIRLMPWARLHAIKDYLDMLLILDKYPKIKLNFSLVPALLDTIEDYAKDGLQGGDPWHVCAKPAYEHYAKKDFPIIREYGFKGLHYVDELTACAPIKCYNYDHPTSRKEVLEYYRKIAQLSTKLFGGFQSE